MEDSEQSRSHENPTNLTGDENVSSEIPAKGAENSAGDGTPTTNEHPTPTSGSWTFPLEGEATEPISGNEFYSHTDGLPMNDSTEPAIEVGTPLAAGAILGEAASGQYRTFSTGKSPKDSAGAASYQGSPKGRKSQNRSLIGVATAAVVVAAVVSGGVSYLVTKNSSTSASTAPVIKQVIGNASVNTASTSSNAIAGLLSKVDPAVVDVTAKGTTSVNGGFFGGGSQSFISEGTGMIMTSNGYVVTNNHVIAGASTVTVTLFSQNKTYKAKIIGTNPTKDVAVLQIQGASNLPTVTFGNSASVKVGDSVVAIGNALGLSGTPTVTQGIVSALGRSINAQSETGATEHLNNLLQTDAPINPGNSGGPLINSAGYVIGMNTAAASGSSSSSSAQNIGFAEPIDSVLQVVKSIEANPNPVSTNVASTSNKGFLGVGVQNLTSSLASQLGYSSSQSGVLVDNVVSGSPASQAGIASGDVITALGGQSVTSVSTLVSLIQSKTSGSKVSVSWVSPNSGQTSATVTLASTPSA